MKIQIKSWLDGSVLFEGDFSCLADAVKAAVKQNSNLSGSNLRYSNLSGSDLSGSNLSGSDLRDSDLRGSNLRGSDLRGSDLRGSDLRGSENIPTRTAAELLMCPEEGAFIGWKKCADGVIAKLLIPAKAARSSATTRKCRAEYVKVLALYQHGKPFSGPAETNAQGVKTVYCVGKITRPDKWDADRWNECSNGIHLFITRTEAENY